MNTLEKLEAQIISAGITKDTALSEASAILHAVFDKKIKTSEKVINTFKEIGLGEMYECPHCNGSHTLIEFGTCHWCGEELAAPSSADTQKRAVKKETTEKVDVVKVEARTKKEKTSVKELTTEKIEAKPAKPVVLGITKTPNDYRSQPDSIQSALDAAKKSENKQAFLAKIAIDFELDIPKPEATTASILRPAIISQLTELLASFEKPKKAPKVIVVEESDFSDDEELTIDEDDETVVTTSDDEDPEDAPEPKAKKVKKEKSAKKDKKADAPANKKTKVVEEEINFDDEPEEKPSKKANAKKPDPVENDELVFEDEEEEPVKPVTKKDKKADAPANKKKSVEEEISFDLDDEDKEIDAVEIEEDEVDLLNDEDEYED